MSMNAQKLAQLQAGVRIGGRGSMRRKKKAKRTRNTTTDEKRLTSTLKRLGVQQIPGIEEINMFKEDGTVIHFTNPKFQASGAANTYVVSGRAEHKKIQDLLPGILDQLPSSNIPGGMGKFADVFSKGLSGAGAGDDDIPDLVENFDTAAAAPPAAAVTSSADSGAAPPAAAVTSAADSGAAPPAAAVTSAADSGAAPPPAAVTSAADSAAAPAPAQSAPLRNSSGQLLGPTGKAISSIPQGLQESEVITVIEKFRALDVDNSGDLDKQELRSLLKATIASNMSDGLLDRFVNGQFENIDSDKSGTISFEEFLVCYAKLKSQ